MTAQQFTKSEKPNYSNLTFSEIEWKAIHRMMEDYADSERNPKPLKETITKIERNMSGDEDLEVEDLRHG